MPNATPTAEHKDWNTWRGTVDTHLQGIKQSQEAIHTCLKKHIEQTDDKLQEVELEVATNKQKTVGEFKVVKTRFNTLHWLIRLIVAGLLGLAFFGLRTQAFGTLTDFSYADVDTVIADGQTIIYDYHFKIYRTDTIASWAIEVDDYESFACYIEGQSLPHADSFAMAALYYQSGTYDSLFARIPGYERSVLDTAITDPAGLWHTFYPLLKYVKIYIYGDTIGGVANPVSTADSNTVSVRIRLSKWKGTRLRIPGTEVSAHHHAEVVGDQDIHGFVNLYADSIEQTRPALVYGYNSNIAYLRPDPGRGLPGSQIYFTLGTTVYRVDTSWTSIANVVDLRFTSSIKLKVDGGDFTFYSADLVGQSSDAQSLGVAGTRWRQLHARGAHTDSVVTTFASIDTLLARVVSKDATAALTIQSGSYAFNVAGYLTTGIRFNANGWAAFKGDGDEFFRVTVLGVNKGDVAFYDNAATPVRHAWWNASNQHLYFNSNDNSYIDASTISELTIFGLGELALESGADITFNTRFSPTSDHGASIGSGAFAVDTVYAADFSVTSSMFSGTGAEALSILETVQALPGDRLDHEVIHPYLTPSSPNTVSLNRWIALLTVAVRELQAEVEYLKKKTE